jgi:hypothetical protein
VSSCTKLPWDHAPSVCIRTEAFVPYVMYFQVTTESVVSAHLFLLLQLGQ